MDFVRANNGFVKRMFIDIYRKDDAYVNKLFYYIMATLFYIAVSLFGPLAFKWGRYKTFYEITGAGLEGLLKLIVELLFSRRRVLTTTGRLLYLH